MGPISDYVLEDFGYGLIKFNRATGETWRLVGMEWVPTTERKGN